MITLIIPDIHCKHSIAEAIIQEEPHDRVVLLGDYFDDWYDTVDGNAATAVWLKKKLKDPLVTCLWGNHDQHYLLDDPYWLCSGFSKRKKAAIRAVMEPHDILGLWLSCLVDGWLATHAGLDAKLLPTSYDGTALDASRMLNQEVLPEMLGSRHSPMLAIPQSRGGRPVVGGVTWQDWRDFSPILHIPQVVGHTEGHLPRESGGSWCLDTGLKHYAIIEDGKITIKERGSNK